jgi:hypothetical protein
MFTRWSPFGSRFFYCKPEVKFWHRCKNVEHNRKLAVSAHTHKTRLHFSPKYFWLEYVGSWSQTRGDQLSLEGKKNFSRSTANFWVIISRWNWVAIHFMLPLPIICRIWIGQELIWTLWWGAKYFLMSKIEPWFFRSFVPKTSLYTRGAVSVSRN